MRTSCPCRTSSSAVCEPTKPAPPVIRILFPITSWSLLSIMCSSITHRTSMCLIQQSLDGRKVGARCLRETKARQVNSRNSANGYREWLVREPQDNSIHCWPAIPACSEWHASIVCQVAHFGALAYRSTTHAANSAKRRGSLGGLV